MPNTKQQDTLSPDTTVQRRFPSLEDRERWEFLKDKQRCPDCKKWFVVSEGHLCDKYKERCWE